MTEKSDEKKKIIGNNGIMMTFFVVVIIAACAYGYWSGQQIISENEELVTEYNLTMFCNPDNLNTRAFAFCVQCGIDCNSFNMTYFKSNTGGLFTGSECWCKNETGSVRIR